MSGQVYRKLRDTDDLALRIAQILDAGVSGRPLDPPARLHMIEELVDAYTVEPARPAHVNSYTRREYDREVERCARAKARLCAPPIDFKTATMEI